MTWLQNTLRLLWIIGLPWILCSYEAYSQIAPEYYAVAFTDKSGNGKSLSQPMEFLSARALERRTRLHIPLDSTDLPVSGQYIDSLRNLGLTVVCTSRWFNLAIVKTENYQLIEKAKNFPFVRSVHKSIPSSSEKKAMRDKWSNESISARTAPENQSDYGVAYTQIHLHKGDTLHTLGFRGKGIQIAILDAGFLHADTLPAFKNLFAEHRILATHDFVSPGTGVFEDHQHGMNVLSIMAGYIPGTYIGTAPEASYYLLRTENTSSEFLVEEYYWAAGAEYADSTGADIIHASLGYTVFDDPSQNHTYGDMNGKSTLVSRAASMAVRKGMLVVVSAGNEGNSSWRYISAPADADSILAVGAITATANLASFSGRGPSSDGRIKPDVVAMGVGTYVQNSAGTFSPGNGTSFSSPVITGLAACLWQAEPSLSPTELRRAILMSANQYENPDSMKGYGIPDFGKALLIARQMNRMKTDSGRIFLAPNPAHENANIWVYFRQTGNFTIEIFSITGSLVSKTIFKESGIFPLSIPLNVSKLNPGIYFIRYSDAMHRKTLRFVKQ